VWAVAQPGDATSENVRAAVEEILRSRNYRDRAMELASHFRSSDGAINAAEEIERLLPTRLIRNSTRDVCEVHPATALPKSSDF
jgi:UDP:flavonoid glycosyltransferase YjiC (YdhE family)